MIKRVRRRQGLAGMLLVIAALFALVACEEMTTADEPEMSSGPNSCRYANDYECDEGIYCPVGTDTADCAQEPEPEPEPGVTLSSGLLVLGATLVDESDLPQASTRDDIPELRSAQWVELPGSNIDGSFKTASASPSPSLAIELEIEDGYEIAGLYVSIREAADSPFIHMYVPPTNRGQPLEEYWRSCADMERIFPNLPGVAAFSCTPTCLTKCQRYFGSSVSCSEVTAEQQAVMGGVCVDACSQSWESAIQNAFSIEIWQDAVHTVMSFYADTLGCDIPAAPKSEMMYRKTRSVWVQNYDAHQYTLNGGIHETVVQPVYHSDTRPNSNLSGVSGVAGPRRSCFGPS